MAARAFEKEHVTMKQEKSCGAVIYTVTDGKRLYLVERMQKGHVSICKGHVEENESEHQTAEREIREEAGLAVEFIEGFRQTIEYSPYPGCSKTVVFFLAHTDDPNVTVQEEKSGKLCGFPLKKQLHR